MISAQLYGRLTGVSPETLAEKNPGEPANGLVHVVSLSLTKIADGLIDPKLVLAWLLNSLGAPGVFIGALVPVREAGALLPQLALTRVVERQESVKRFWALGAVLQGLAAVGIAGSAFTLEGSAAGLAVVLCLALLACARSMCSISYKSALALTIGKSRRGAVSGLAGTVASTGVLAFGAGLALGVIPLTTMAIATAVLLAGVFWIAGAVLFLLLKEKAATSTASDDGFVDAILGPLYKDPQLRRFIAARAFLTATALAPPFLVLLADTGSQNGLGQLGPMVLASAAASIVSAYVWGRLSDHSSRLTLAISGGLGAAVLGASAVVGGTVGGLGGAAGAAAAVFAAQIAYEGVRSGRKIHLTDMTSDDERFRYTAISNTAIGVVLLAGGGFGVLADVAGPEWTLAALAAICLAAVSLALTLDEVQSESRS